MRVKRFDNGGEASDAGLAATPQASAFTDMFGKTPMANYAPSRSVGQGVSVAQPYTPTFTNYASQIQPGIPNSSPAFNPFDYSGAPTNQRLSEIEQSLNPFMTAPQAVNPGAPIAGSYSGYNPFSGDANPYSLTRAPMDPQPQPAPPSQPFGAAPQGGRMVGSGVAVAQQPQTTPQPFSRDTMLNRNPFLDQYFQPRNPFALTSSKTMGGNFGITPTPAPLAPSQPTPPSTPPVATPPAAPAQPRPSQPASIEDNIRLFLSQNPNMTDSQLAQAMNQYGVSPQQFASAINAPLDLVQGRYNTASIENNIRTFLSQNSGMSDLQLAQAMDQYGISPEQFAKAINAPLDLVQGRYNTAMGR